MYYIVLYQHVLRLMHRRVTCLNFAFIAWQMEMHLILPYLLRRFSFTLAPPYDKLMDYKISAGDAGGSTFRGVNSAGTMGPMDLDSASAVGPTERYSVAMKLRVSPR